MTPAMRMTIFSFFARPCPPVTFIAGRTVVSYRDIEPYDYFGWLAMMDGAPRLTGAVAVTHCDLCVVSAVQFQEVLLAHPMVRRNFLSRVGGTVRRYTARIQELTPAFGA